MIGYDKGKGFEASFAIYVSCLHQHGPCTCLVVLPMSVLRVCAQYKVRAL